jgi:hypothetical protein
MRRGLRVSGDSMDGPWCRRSHEASSVLPNMALAAPWYQNVASTFAASCDAGFGQGQHLNSRVYAFVPPSTSLPRNKALSGRSNHAAASLQMVCHLVRFYIRHHERHRAHSDVVDEAPAPSNTSGGWASIHREDEGWEGA